MRYDPRRDLGWLLLRPWVAIPRLVQVLWSLAGLVLVLLLRGGSRDAAVQQGLARRILNTLTGLGPCFIKLGQALSTRPDLVRRDWLEELTRLQDDLPAFSHAVALACIREELGAPAEELFEEFPDSPIAAASLGQVYKARLQGKHWVAVKVQRPNLTFILRRDLVLIRALGVMTAPLLPLNLGFGLGGIIDEFGRSLLRGSRLSLLKTMPSMSRRWSGCSAPPVCSPPPGLMEPRCATAKSCALSNSIQRH